MHCFYNAKVYARNEWITVVIQQSDEQKNAQAQGMSTARQAVCSSKQRLCCGVPVAPQSQLAVPRVVLTSTSVPELDARWTSQ